MVKFLSTKSSRYALVGQKRGGSLATDTALFVCLKLYVSFPMLIIELYVSIVNRFLMHCISNFKNCMSVLLTNKNFSVILKLTYNFKRGESMAGKHTTIRYSEDEKPFYELLAKLVAKEIGYEKEPEVTLGIRQAVKEALIQRGVEVPPHLFGVKKEGRPNPEALATESSRASNIEAGLRSNLVPASF